MTEIEAGNASAVNQLIDLWQKRVYNMAFKMMGDHDKSMDIVQKTFIKMYKSLAQLKDKQKFKSWLYRIVVNYCKDDLRKVTRTEPIQDMVLNFQDRERAPQETIEQTELKDVMLSALQKIPEEQKTIIIMKEYEGFKFHEIADTLNISINTAKSRMYYGLKSMRKVLLANPKSKEIYYEIYNH